MRRSKDFRSPAVWLYVVACVSGCGGSDPKPLVVQDLTMTLEEDTSATATVSAVDPDGHSLTFSAARPPAHGALTINATTGVLTYTPAADYFGSDAANILVTAGSKSATVNATFTVTNVPDAPRIASIPDQSNNAYDLVTNLPLDIVDVDGNAVTVTVQVDEPQIASAAVGSDANSLQITPLARGATAITVTASDGQLSASRSFTFAVGDVTKTVTVPARSPNANVAVAADTAQTEGHVIALTNRSTRNVPFTLTYNGHKAFTSIDDVIDHVRAMPERSVGESFGHKLWRFVRHNTYHDVPINDQQWWYAYWPTLNSLGFGFCGHVAAVFVQIARAAGYDARIWGLYGHVVPEILEAGRWQMFDPDLDVYYYTRAGDVAGVEELAADPSLITSPTAPIYGSAENFAYSATVADIYDALEDNNYIGDTVFLDPAPSGSSRITLPAGSRLLLPGHWTPAPTGYDGDTPYPVRAYRQAALELPAGWTGPIDLPWVLWDVQGQGSIELGGKSIAADSPELRAFLTAPGQALTSASILENPNGLRLVFMINATWYDLLDSNELKILGQDVWAVGIGMTSVSPDIQVEPFPSELRRSRVY